MKLNSILKILGKTFLVFILCTSLFFAKTKNANSALFDLIDSQGVVIEHLRLKVPKEYRQAWLSAEKKSWEPWLNKKNGFKGRELFWDPKNEEATLLIRWNTRDEWKEISQSEIDQVQERFEEFAKKTIGSDLRNPFPIVFEGELLEQ